MVKNLAHNFGQHDSWTGSSPAGIKSRSYQDWMSHMTKQIEFNLKTEWDSNNLTTMLNALLDRDIPGVILFKYRLDGLVKGVNKQASRNFDKPVAELSAKLMEKWRKRFMETKCPTQGNHYSPTPPMRLTDHAPSIITGSKPASNLAPSPFFSRPSSIRPLFTGSHRQQQQQQRNMTTFLDQLEQESNATSTSTATNYPSTTTTKSRHSGATRHVRFKPDHEPATVKRYSSDTFRDRNQPLSSPKSVRRHHSFPPSSFSSPLLTTWYPPRRILIPESCRRHNSRNNNNKIKTQYNKSGIKIIPLFENGVDGDDDGVGGGDN